MDEYELSENQIKMFEILTYNKALEDFTRQLSVRLIELPLDDLIVADILNDVKGIYEQLKK